MCFPIDPGGRPERVAATRPLVISRIAEPIEQAGWLDSVSAPLQAQVRALIPLGTRLKDVLSGTWLGHPLHPALTDVVLGSWLSAWLVDLSAPGERHSAADGLVAAGVVASIPTAASGVSDWAELRGGSQRVGVVHGLLNTTAVGLQVSSLRLRRRGRRPAAVGLSTAALGIASAAAWLGGHLSFGKGVGVNEWAFDDVPGDWTKAISEDKLDADVLVRRSVNGTGILFVRHGGTVHALTDRCSHRGCSLSQGKFDGTAITCPCHGSQFGLDGSLLRGPATAGQRALDVRSLDGQIEIRARS
jgi:nitrite reductase/ring-hydroxylating ferredoxin subunit/uncharacterized membrane protein